MNDFLQNWKDEHMAIQRAFAAAIKLDICSKAGQEKMRESKEILLKHLQNEDDTLYPALKKAAETNRALKKILGLFATDMDKIVPAVLAFFEKYESDPTAEDLSFELGKIVSMLRSRINREESIFVKEYERTLG